MSALSFRVYKKFTILLVFVTFENCQNFIANLRGSYECNALKIFEKIIDFQKKNALAINHQLFKNKFNFKYLSASSFHLTL